jgi:hypothetical protein
MDLIPGQEYNFTLTLEDPGYAEAGLASINTKKSIYHINETVEIVIVVLNTEGHLVSGASVILNITDPDNNLYSFSTLNSNIIETQRGIYEASFPNTNLEGNYTMFVQAIGNSVNNTMLSHFTVKKFYEFDILRQTPVVIDPWKGPFTSSIRIISFINVSIFNYSEVLPTNFTVINSSGAIETISNNKIILNWMNVPNNSVVNYSAQAPLTTPELYEVGPSIVSYNNGKFTEARQWFIAADPVCVGDEFNFSTNSHGPVGTITSFKCKNCGTVTSDDSFFGIDDTATAADMFDFDFSTDGVGNKLKIKDKGAGDFNVLKIDTGINTSAYIPGDIVLRIVSVDFKNPTTCKGKQMWADIEGVDIYVYNSSTSVNTTPLSFTSGFSLQDSNSCAYP